MANSLSPIIPKILSRGLMTLREFCMMPRLVNGDYSSDAAKKGDVINVPIPTAVGTRDVTPAAVSPTPTDSTEETVQIPLNFWRQTDPVHLTDEELNQIDKQAFWLPSKMDEGIKSLANYVNDRIFEEYKGVYGAVGTAGTTPFASNVSAATAARKLLHQQLAPKRDRRAVMDFDAEENAISLSEFSDADKIGTNQVRIEGELGRKYGLNWFADHAVPTHTAGSASGVLVNDPGATLAVGDKSVPIDTGTGSYVAGDIITFAGDTQQYTVTAASTVASGSVAISPGLKAVPANNAAVANPLADHVVNLAFHRDAFAYAQRPLIISQSDMALGGNMIRSITDPQTGISLRLEVKRLHKLTVWEFDILFGRKLVRPELAVRILG